ncbi:MAG: agmatine deiminase family protein [Bacteroidota bacterium]
MKTLIPEWTTPDSIALVWPEHLRAGTGKLKNFYLSFIDTLLPESSVIIIVQNEKDADFINSRFSKSVKPEIVLIPEISDIWIRDFGPQFYSVEGKAWSFFFNYQPNYFHTSFQNEIMDNNNKAGRKFAGKLGYKKFEIIKVKGTDLNLDGGNFVHNGAGTALVSNRIITDNENLLIEDVRETFRTELGIDHLIIVPTEPYDDTGHMDGAVRFINENTVLVSKYPDSAEDKSRIWSDTVAGHLQCLKFDVIRIVNNLPREGRYSYKKAEGTLEFFENAWGNYLNFLRIGNTFYLPQYQGQGDLNQKVIKTIEDIRGSKVIPVEIPDELSAYGGLLNCITLPLFFNSVK